MRLSPLTLLITMALASSVSAEEASTVTAATDTPKSTTEGSTFDWGDENWDDSGSTDEDSWGDDWGDDSWDTASPWQPVTGFVELAAGTRLQDDATGLSDQTLNEVRTRVESGYQGEHLRGTLRADVRYDDVVEGWEADIRNLSVSLPLGDAIDLKLGRQVMTWGTGDFLFLNDLFAKDWQAFFSGLDDEYLKAPVNAIKASYFGSGLNLDLAWMPRFESDHYLNGERFSYFNPATGTSVAPEFDADEPDEDALAARLFGTRGSTEFALYGYWGYSGQPVAMDSSGSPAFAALEAYGASVLSPVRSGIAHAEVSYHDFTDQSGGMITQPMDKWMALIGYQQEIATNLTLGLQYQLEHYQDYDEYADNYPYTDYMAEQDRELATVRLNYRAMQEKLNLSLFTFYSPTDEDYYLRPQINYRFSDAWSLTVGANLLGGEQDHTFFGQLEDNSNAWARIRFNY